MALISELDELLLVCCLARHRNSSWPGHTLSVETIFDLTNGAADYTIFYANFYKPNESACEPTPVCHFLGLYANSSGEKAQLVACGNIVGNAAYQVQ